MPRTPARAEQRIRFEDAPAAHAPMVLLAIALVALGAAGLVYLGLDLLPVLKNLNHLLSGR